MSLRSEPGAMRAYQRDYSRRRNLPARERDAIDAAIAETMESTCLCHPCVVLRAVGTVRAAIPGLVPKNVALHNKTIRRAKPNA